MPPLSHESLTVYQRAIEFVGWSSVLIKEKEITGPLLDQFKRSFISVPLNIAEGAGKHTAKDQARFYDIAKGSALECGACLDVLVAMGDADPGEIKNGKRLLGEVVAMLMGLTRSIAPGRVREEEAEYNV